jgi:hypothetical protein
MIEVFKTNVIHLDHAHVLVQEIHKMFRGYQANFDLEDCDKILRIKSSAGSVNHAKVIDLLQNFGVNAEVLPDEVTPSEKKLSGLPFCLAFRMVREAKEIKAA